ncbi:MAG: ATP phosphoribosyltransferase regulatory subunit [Inquilinaceae bacterium]
MTGDLANALLPDGLRDLLPPDAAHEAATVERLVTLLAGYGYDRVKPPLVEFEDSLLGGFGAAMTQQTFRLMDPVSQRMMGVRADMTLQVARIARARLRRAPRPLRLAYAGQVLQVKGSQLRPERQFTQVGAELIGVDLPEADAEVALVAARTLDAIGVEYLSLDLNAPTLVPAILGSVPLEPGAEATIRRALDRKDAALVAETGGPAADLLGALLAASGPAGPALDAVAGLDLPGPARAVIDRLVAVVGLVVAGAPGLAVTVDFVEHRGFEYHSGVSFTLFGRGVRGELGRGGRYSTGNGDARGEPATGLTLFMDSVLRALPAAESRRRVYIPAGTEPSVADRLRAEGWVAVPGLTATDDEEAEARRLLCDSICRDGAAHRLG